MTDKKKEKALGILRDAIIAVVGADFGDLPVVYPKGHHSDYSPTLAWEGLYEWTVNVNGGCSIYAGELGNYSSDQESKIKCAVERVKNMGLYFEAENNCIMSIGER